MKLLSPNQTSHLGFTNKSKFLLASVFITGAVVLVIEIIAIRILSPYYGNTLYTTSSVIGIVLAALSAGYYAGGKLADAHPEHHYFYLIIFISGLLVLGIQTLNKTLLPVFGLLLPITIGPLVAAVFLFLVPCFSLGLLSPYAVALHKQGSTVGGRAGEVFFWSTTGSIAGSLSAGFLLIPNFGVSTIIITSGITLCGVGILGLFAHKENLRNILALAIICAAFVALAFLQGPQQENVIYQKDGIYEKIKISEGMWNGHPVRFLFQDRSYSAAMRLDSDELAYEYTKYYALYQLFKPNPANAFIIGGGAYSIPKALFKDSATIAIDVTEIEPSLYALSKQYFNLPETSRLINHTQDGRYFLSHTSADYDMVISDVYYSFFSIPIQFTTKEFFTLAKNHLTENGVFIGNFIGDTNPEAPSFLFSEIKTFQSVFPNSYFFAVENPKQTKGQNIIFLGINGKEPIDFNSPMVRHHANPIIRQLVQKRIELANINLAHHQEITDNFAPVEYYVSKALARWQY